MSISRAGLGLDPILSLKPQSDKPRSGGFRAEDRDIDTMQSAYNTPPLNLTGQPAAELDVDLLVIPYSSTTNSSTNRTSIARREERSAGRARAASSQGSRTKCS